MRIAVVWSSPNVDGLTASAKNRFIEGLKKTGTEIDEIHLNKHHRISIFVKKRILIHSFFINIKEMTT